MFLTWKPPMHLSYNSGLDTPDTDTTWLSLCIFAFVMQSVTKCHFMILCLDNFTSIQIFNNLTRKKTKILNLKIQQQVDQKKYMYWIVRRESGALPTWLPLENRQLLHTEESSWIAQDLAELFNSANFEQWKISIVQDLQTRRAGYFTWGRALE